MTFKHLIVLLLALFLISCGGGSSDSGGGGTEPPANKAPIANAASDQTVDENTEVTLSGSGTDSDGSIASYSWTQTSGPSVTLTNSSSASTSFIAPDINTDETLSFELKVTDDDGATAIDSVDIFINQVNQAPTVNAGDDQTVNELTEVALSGSGTDSDGTIASYEWTQTAGVAVTLINASTDTFSFDSPITSVVLTLTFQLIVTDNEGASATDSVNITVNPIDIGLIDIPKVVQTLSFDRPISIDVNAPLNLISPYAGSSYLDTQAESSIERLDIDEMMMVVNQDEQVVMLGKFIKGKTNQELSSKTTAVTLLSLFPSLASTYSNDPQKFTTLISDFEEVTALAGFINANADWSLGEDANFISAYADAVKKIYGAIENGYFSSSTQSKSFSSERKRVKTNNFSSRVSVVSTSTEGIKSGITLEVTGEQTQEENPEFKLTIDNAFNRYAVIVVGDEQHDYGLRSFMVGPEEYWYGSVVEFYKSEMLLQSEAGTNVYAYGMGQGIAALSSEAEYGYHAEATLATLIHYQVIPRFTAQWGMKAECLKEKWLPLTENGGFPSIINSTATSLYNYMPILEQGTNYSYVQASSAAWGNLLSENKKDIVNCIIDNAADILSGKVKGSLTNKLKAELTDYVEGTLKISKLFNSLIGKVNDFMNLLDDLDKITSLSPKLTAVFEAAHKFEEWNIQNKHIKSTDKLKISGNVSGDAYESSFLLSNLFDYKYEFSGDCPQDTICEYFVYPRTIPFIVDFESNCVDANNTTSMCRNIVIDFGDTKSIGGTTNNPTIPLNGDSYTKTYTHNESKTKQSYTGKASVADLDGAYAEYDFKIQVEEAVPDLKIFVDGELYQEGVNNTFNCDSSEIIEKKLTLINSGLGDLYLAESGAKGDRAGWESDMLNDDLILSRGEQVNNLTISNDCSDINDNNTWSNTYFDSELSHIKQIVTFTVDPFLPPIAYDANYTVAFDGELVKQLQADDGKGFRIVTQPTMGTVDLNVQDGTFTYTPEQNITQDTIDSFTFVATNDSAGISEGGTGIPGESNEATVTVEITANPYTISVGNYRPSFKDGVSEQLSIAPNQSVTFYNSVTKIIGANLDGQPVVIKSTYNGDYNYWAYDLPQAEFGPNDVIIGTYNFTLQDLTNNRAVSVPVELTVSNEAYRRIVGTTLTVHGYGFDNASVHFKENFTYTVNGEQRGSYSFTPGIYDSYVTCADSVIDKVNIGAIQTNGRSGAYGELPSYIMIHEDGTYSSNSFYGCPERTSYKRIF